MTHDIAFTSNSSTEKYRVLALCGSLRRDSYNMRLLECAAAASPENLDVQIFRGLGLVPAFNEDIEDSQSADGTSIEDLRSAVRSARGLLIATPEYNRSIPGQLKNVIDWLSRPSPDEALAGKPTMIFGASSGPWGTRLAQSALRQVLHATESLVIPSGELFVRDAAHVMGDTDTSLDSDIQRKLEKLMAEFRQWIDLVSTGRSNDA